MKKPVQQITDMPNGSLVTHRNKIFFVSAGLDDRIVTDVNGNWKFLHELNWKTFQIVYNPLSI